MVFSAVGKGEILPKDAVLLTKSQALKYQTLLINKWEPQSHVFVTQYGHYFLAACTIVPSTLMNFTMRGKLKLFNIGAVPTYLSTVAAPAMFTAMIYTKAVREDILLLKGKSCPTCLEAKGILIQNCFGILFPVSMALITNCIIARETASVTLPYFMDWKALLRKWASLTNSLSRIVAYSFVLHTLAASIVTYKSIQEVIQVNDCLKLLDQQEEQNMSFDEYQ